MRSVAGEIVSYPLKDITNLRVTAYALNDVGQQVSQGDVTAAFQGLITYENHVMTVQFPAAGAWPEGLGADWVYEIVYETPFPEGREIGARIAFQNTARLDGYYVTANWNGEFRRPATAWSREIPATISTQGQIWGR